MTRSRPIRADIYSLGCVLYYLMTARPPFLGETEADRRKAHREHPAPQLRLTRPDAPSSLESAYQKMMAKRPDDRPESMMALIALLEACRTPAARTSTKAAGGAKSSRKQTAQAPPIKRADRHQSPLPTRQVSPKQPLRDGRPVIVIALGALALAGIAVGYLVLSPGPSRTAADADRPPEPSQERKDKVSDDGRTTAEKAVSNLRPQSLVRTIFDGKSSKGWMLTNRKPLPSDRIQPDGLNPHGTGSYLVAHEKKLGDFVLEFDYKLSKGCNSGLFVRVGDLDDPVNTGIEVALDETTGNGYTDSGAFYDLVAPSENAQKPTGEWNHMSIMAAGPVLAVALNGKDVSRINLDEWTVTGKRPDGTDHKFRKRPIAEFPRSGYIGFQDHGRDCWFKNIVLKTPVETSDRRPS